MLRLLIAWVCLSLALPIGVGVAGIDKRPWREAPAVWQKVVQAEVDAHAAPGMMVAAWIPGKRLVLAAAGSADAMQDVALTPQTRMSLDGLRPFLVTVWTWCSLQAGTITLDDMIPGVDKTVRDVLRSGQDDAMDHLVLWLEKQTGMTLQQALQDTIFDVLDEDDLGFPLPERTNVQSAKNYIAPHQDAESWQEVKEHPTGMADLYDIMLLVKSVFDEDVPLSEGTRRQWLVFDDPAKPGQSLGALSRLDQPIGTFWLSGGEAQASTLGVVYSPLADMYLFGFANAPTPRLSIVMGHIALLAAQAVDAPRPVSENDADSKTIVLPVSKCLDLTWQNGFFHPERYDVYLSRDEHAVREGLETVRIASTVQRTEKTPPLLPGTRYYWRVDSIQGDQTIPGPLWSFTTGYIDVRKEN
ncbi:hypothetical protein [Desulfovibrio inopinatus]|uniref:hypothetical protein n=1 Tax=Desulfovibrio inopinatus TaxID=102109 RepID=UPI00040F8368|nr:hypothetical protein [Desulfovibrio inopinatus]